MGAAVGRVLGIAGHVFLHSGLVDTDVVFPGADDGKIGAGNGGHAVVRAGGKFELELVGEGRTVDLVLVPLGQSVAGLLSIVAGPLAAGITQTAGRGTQVGAGTAQVLLQVVGQVPEQGLEVLGAGTDEDHVAGGTVQVGDAGAVLVPQVHQGAQVLGGVVETGGLGNTHGMEMLNARELGRNIRIATDDTTAVPENTDNAAMLPGGDPVLVGKLKLTKDVPNVGLGLCLLLEVGDETRPWTFFQFVQ